MMNPYSRLPKNKFWRKFVSNTPWHEVEISDDPKFKIAAHDKVATAGSCFAQHIARYLRKSGREIYITEKPHPIISTFGGDIASYEFFPARFGNIYTVRQCLELFQQSFSLLSMIEDFVEDHGRYYDLLRPNILKEGFSSLREATADRAYHLICVRKMFEKSDVFIFTLGLTESWYNARQGYTYPVCPGTARGAYFEDQHCFKNFTYAEVLSDLELLIKSLKSINIGLKIILTVSPVPLVATYTNKNVLLASSYSKSVLRSVCGEIESRYDHVQYFPSFEIINHCASFGQYLESDLRGVTERGVKHVMDYFIANFYSSESKEASPRCEEEKLLEIGSDIFQVECDEIMNDPNFLKKHQE